MSPFTESKERVYERTSWWSNIVYASQVLSSQVALRGIKMAINMNSAWNKIAYYKSRQEIKHFPGGVRMKRILMPFCYCSSPFIRFVTADNTTCKEIDTEQPTGATVTSTSSILFPSWRAIRSHTFIIGYGCINLQWAGPVAWLETGVSGDLL